MASFPDEFMRESFEEALDDLHRAAEILGEIGTTVALTAMGEEAQRQATDAILFAQHIRTEWNR